MRLSDFEEAIKNVKAIIGDCCFMRMYWAFDGSAVIFFPNTGLEADDVHYIYFRKSHRLVKRYADTWKNPEHKEVLYRGDE